MRWHLNHTIHGRKPWAVQEAYLAAAAGRPRFGNFSQQGLGKTSDTLNEFVDFDDVDLCVVLAPMSFMADWPLAPAEWGLGFMNTGMWDKDNLDAVHGWDCGLFSIAHETLRGSKRARDELLDLFKKRRCMLVFDESTGIKNHKSVLARYCIGALSKHATYIRELNGTPLVQNALDYYAQLRLLGELDGINPYAFRNRYCVMGGYMGRQIKEVKNEEQLGQILDRCSFRALKKDWRKDMPEQLAVPIHLEMTDNQRRHYATMMNEFYAAVGNDEEINAELVLTQRLKLQQISSCMLMDRGKVHWLEEPKTNPKLRAALDLMNTGSGKMIVVYYFDPSGRMLIDQFQKEGFEPAYITGKMKAEDIVAQKDRFNNDSSCRVMVGQIDQTSRGHTLLGQKGNDRCSRIYYYETDLSLMHRLQMNDRNHRGEQDETCYLYDPICSPIDQLNVDILTGKKNQADGMDEIVRIVRERRAISS
jgi:SNF2 family DNA or RNA helicase